MTVDWFQLLADLQRHAGMGRAAVARELELPESTVKGWYYGSFEPNYRNGAALVVLWSQRTDRPATDVPKAAMAVSAARAR